MIPMTRQDVVRTIHQLESQIRALHVQRLGLFGSFLRDQSTSLSDVDLLVEFEPGYETFRNYMTLAFLLEDNLLRRVELLTPESLSPYIGPKILHEVQDVLTACDSWCGM